MIPMILDILVLLFVAAAAVYMVVRLRRMATGQSKCECGARRPAAPARGHVRAAFRARRRPAAPAASCPCSRPRAIKASAGAGRSQRHPRPTGQPQISARLAVLLVPIRPTLLLAWNSTSKESPATKISRRNREAGGLVNAGPTFL